MMNNDAFVMFVFLVSWNVLLSLMYRYSNVMTVAHDCPAVNMPSLTPHRPQMQWPSCFKNKDNEMRLLQMTKQSKLIIFTLFMYIPSLIVNN